MPSRAAVGSVHPTALLTAQENKALDENSSLTPSTAMKTLCSPPWDGILRALSKINKVKHAKRAQTERTDDCHNTGITDVLAS